jgi:hypothetical protein
MKSFSVLVVIEEFYRAKKSLAYACEAAKLWQSSTKENKESQIYYEIAHLVLMKWGSNVKKCQKRSALFKHR